MDKRIHTEERGEWRVVRHANKSSLVAASFGVDVLDGTDLTYCRLGWDERGRGV